MAKAHDTPATRERKKGQFRTEMVLPDLAFQTELILPNLVQTELILPDLVISDRTHFTGSGTQPVSEQPFVDVLRLLSLPNLAFRFWYWKLAFRT